MKIIKRKISWLLISALVFASMVVGFGQVKTEAAPMSGTGFFKLEIQVAANGVFELSGSSGTDSDFRLELLNSDNIVVGQTADDTIIGDPDKLQVWGDPLEDGRLTTYAATAGAGGDVQVVALPMGNITVNNTITKMRLTCTTFKDNWRFADVRLWYSTTGDHSNWVQLTAGDWQGDSQGDVGIWIIDNEWFYLNNKILTFDADGGTGGGVYDAIPGQTIIVPDAGSKTDHIFTGYDPAVPSIMPNADTTYTAQWTTDIYYIIFNGNGNTDGGMKNQGIVSGTSAALNPNTFIKTGYSFTGWNTAADGSGTAYADKTDFGPMGTADITLYAQWSIKQYRITFNSNGGSAVASVTQNYGTTVNEPPEPAKADSIFRGWYSDARLKKPVVWPYIVEAKNTTIYAGWISPNVDITFDANGGEGSTGPNSMEVGSPLNAPAVSRPGYVFVDWEPTVPAAVPFDSTVYTAVWKPVEMGVTMSGSDFIVNIKDWTEDQNYQIWTYQKASKDNLLADNKNFKKDQWILSMSYTSALAGDFQSDGSIDFRIPIFSSPTEDYVVALRVADEKCRFVAEIREDFTAEEVQEAVITKILVDGRTAAKGDVRKKIESGANLTIEVIGNDVENLAYNAEVIAGACSTFLTPGNGGNFSWDISALEQGNYAVKFTAMNSTTADERIVNFEFYAEPGENAAVLHSMKVSYSNGVINIVPNFTNGQFCYRLCEPGCAPFHGADGYATNDPIDYAYDAPGTYEIIGYANGTQLIDLEKGYNDSMAVTFVIPRTDGPPVSVTLNGNVPLKRVKIGTALQITANAKGVTGEALYSFRCHDDAGTVLLQDWSTNNTLNWTPGRVDNYNIEVRVKGDGAGSFEAHSNVVIKVI